MLAVGQYPWRCSTAGALKLWHFRHIYECLVSAIFPGLGPHEPCPSVSIDIDDPTHIHQDRINVFPAS